MVVSSKSNLPPDIVVGSLWKENDPRQDRYVVIVATYSDAVDIIRVNPDGSAYPKARRAEAQRSRFRSQRSGYSFVRNKAVL